MIRLNFGSVAMATAGLALVLGGGCDEGTTGTNTNPNNPNQPGPQATSGEVDSCKEACNQLKFFSCNDAVEHAACFQSCDVASSSEIEVFAACVRNDVCDAECSLKIKPPPTVAPPAPVPSDCISSCDAFANACVPELSGNCNLVCGGLSDAEKALAVYCLNAREGCALPAACEEELTISGPEPEPAEDCKDACDREAFFSCITAADQATCRNLCDTVDATTLENYVACGSGGSGPCNSCYSLINSSGPSADVAGCKEACDQMKFFDCIDAAGQTTCRNTCEQATTTQVDNFKACTQGLCQDDSCLSNLGL